MSYGIESMGFSGGLHHRKGPNMGGSRVTYVVARAVRVGCGRQARRLLEANGGCAFAVYF